MTGKNLTYHDSGVDITAGNKAVELMKRHVASTSRPGVLGGIGGFGGLFELDIARYRQPVLVAGTDGVGSKVEIARQQGRLDTVGIDLVAMAVNDILAQGAEPLFFLDYVAVGNLIPEMVASLVSGVAEGCRQAGCALIGGETAEMPGVYEAGRFDLAGFAVGVVEKDRIIDGSRIRPGDVLVGLRSNGLHSNGFSLVRRIVEKAGWTLDEPCSGLGCSLGEELLKPTRIYVHPVLEAMGEFDVRGVAHITGGGLVENIPRIIPEGFGAVLRRGSWPVPGIFSLLRRGGPVAEEEMLRVFNLGLGLILMVSPGQAGDLVSWLAARGEEAFIVGEVQEGVTGVALDGGWSEETW